MEDGRNKSGPGSWDDVIVNSSYDGDDMIFPKGRPSVVFLKSELSYPKTSILALSTLSIVPVLFSVERRMRYLKGHLLWKM
jgi:hypothetical protein